MKNIIVDNVLVSIIIPVYNGEKYIEDCLISLKKQTYSYFEVIIVDDHSTDRTYEQCVSFTRQDSRFKVYPAEGKGVGNARNQGLLRARGEWFGFVDTDDWVEANYLEVLLSNAIKYQCDVSVCGFEVAHKRPFSLDEKDGDGNVRLITSEKDCIHDYICQEKESIQAMVWNKLYRASKYRDVKFDVNLKINEDCIYMYDILCNTTKLCKTDHKLYYWYVHNDSACHKRPMIADFEAANVFLKLLNKTAYLRDGAIEFTLKRNYLINVVNVLFYARYNSNDDTVVEVKKRIAEWMPGIKTSLFWKERIKCFCVLKQPRLLEIYKKRKPQ